MLELGGFYGRTVSLPEELLYYKDQELWVKPWTEPQTWAFGFTEAGVAMISGFTYLEFIAAVGDFIRERSPVLAVDTYKVSFELYSPLSGKVVYLNQELEGEGVKVIDEAPYDHVLFALKVEADFDPRRVFLTAGDYLKALEERQANICGT